MNADFAPLAGRALWARRTLALVALAVLAALLSDALQLSLLQKVEWGGVRDDELTANDTRQAAVAVVQLAAIVLAAGFFLAWFYRANRNLRAFGAQELRYGPRWAAGSWFVPIANIFVPKQIANDLWRASDPDLPHDADGAWRRGRVPRWHDLWWGALLVGGMLVRLAETMHVDATTLGELKAATVVFLVGDAVVLAAALLAMKLVAETTARQHARAQNLGLVG